MLDLLTGLLSAVAAAVELGSAAGADTVPTPAPAAGWAPDFKSPFKAAAFSYNTLESSMFAWQGKHYMMEGIGCSAHGGPFWANDSAVLPGATMDPAFFNHSYVRIREVGSGLVVVNIPNSQGFGFPNAHVDYEHNVVWIFATPIDRCGNPRYNKSDVFVQSWHSKATNLGELSSWSSAVAGGTEGYAVPNVDVGRVIMTDSEFKSRGLPPHKAIMIGEAAEFHLNNQQDGDLTKGWLKSKYTVQDHDKVGLGCPSVRFGTDGYYYVVSGMGPTWNGIARSKDLVSWTYGRGTCQMGQHGQPPPKVPGCHPEKSGGCCGALNRPAPGSLTIGPLNAWFAANVPPKFKLNADPLNQPIWNGDNNDPDVCCQAADGKEEAISYIVYGVSSQGRSFVNASVRPPGKTLGMGVNNIGVYNGTLTQFMSSYF